MKSNLVIIVVLAIVVAGCSQKQSPSAPPAPVLVAKAFMTNVPVQIQPMPFGHVVAFASVAVHSQIGGILSQVHFTEGAEVKSNSLLITIDPRPMEAALARDKAQLENAEAQFKRDQNLFEQKIESRDQFDTSRANRDTLAATVQTDELNLSFTEIRAPFDGITGALQKHVGDIIKAPDDVLLTLNQIHPIYVQFSVPEQYLPEIRKQKSVRELQVQAFYDNMTASPPKGEVTFVDNSVDTSTGTIQLRATFPNDDGTLWPGQYVRVMLTISEMTNAIIVPSQAVQNGQNGQFVYVVKPDQTAEERPVTIGMSDDGMTVIQKGLDEGETVVTDGQLRLLSGAKVSVKTADSHSNTNSLAK